MPKAGVVVVVVVVVWVCDALVGLKSFLLIWVSWRFGALASPRLTREVLLSAAGGDSEFHRNHRIPKERRQTRQAGIFTYLLYFSPMKPCFCWFSKRHR